MIRNLFRPNRRKEEQRQIEEERAFARERDSFASAQNEDLYTMEIEKGRSDLIRWQQDFEEDLIALKHQFRNEYFDKDRKQWVKRMSIVYKEKTDEKGNVSIVEVQVPMRPMINEHGIAMIESLVRPFMSRNMFNTNFDDTRILKMLLSTSNELVDNLTDNYDSYGVEFTNNSLIVRIVKNFITPGPYRALKGWGKSTDIGQIKRVENLTMRDHAQKRRLWG